ncbi:MAG: tetratricopeptide repeat protein [Acidobacteriota bacterium]|nr:tetratricopeptide repeat protein [Acidobacteriota bacterium]
MAQPATTPKLEELRFKLKTDPKSRLFYQLAEELRKAGHFDESEHVLRSGLVVYPTYLAAWVSLGRTLREQKNDAEAVDALNTALQLDPGNIVAARILADAYLALGEKLEALKKYKLVHALLPSDEELRVTIEQLERDLHEPAEALSPFQEPAPEEAFVAPPAAPAETPAAPAETVEQFIPAMEPPPAPVEPVTASPFEEDSPFDRTMPPFANAARSFDDYSRDDESSAQQTADVEPMLAAHDESPFEEPLHSFTADAFAVETPAGMHIESMPADDEEPVHFSDPKGAVVEAAFEDAANTVTMADLYVRQGLVEQARNIYEHILARDGENADVRAKLAAISPQVNPRVATLERWLGKVSRREVGRV